MNGLGYVFQGLRLSESFFVRANAWHRLPSPVGGSGQTEKVSDSNWVGLPRICNLSRLCKRRLAATFSYRHAGNNAIGELVKFDRSTTGNRSEAGSGLCTNFLRRFAADVDKQSLSAPGKTQRATIVQIEVAAELFDCCTYCGGCE